MEHLRQLEAQALQVPLSALKPGLQLSEKAGSLFLQVRALGSVQREQAPALKLLPGGQVRQMLYSPVFASGVDAQVRQAELHLKILPVTRT